MLKFRLCIVAVSLLAFGFGATRAQAQSRVFVAAQGSDSNPCTFASPCRTFQHAHDVVAGGGEINVLDPAGYGAVIITKALSIQGHGFSGISVSSGGTGITINAGASDAVNLSGLIVEGAGVGNLGIVFNSGKSLTIAQSVVRGFTSHGIKLAPNAAVRIAVSDTLAANNAGHGITVQPLTGVVGVVVGFVRVDADHNGQSGFALDTTACPVCSVQGVAEDSTAIGNGGAGFLAAGPTNNAGSDFVLSRCTASGNASGVTGSTPSAGGSGSATLEVSGCNLQGNQTPWSKTGGGEVLSYGDNLTFNSAPPTGNLTKQ
jgi:hypothetical protein